MTATVVLVHGAWHGAWCWDLVVEQLLQQDVPVVAIDLPGHGASTEPLTDLHGHGDAVRAALDAIDGPVVLVGHSYGGAVITNAAAGNTNVKALVYIDAFIPNISETTSGRAGRRAPGCPRGRSTTNGRGTPAA